MTHDFTVETKDVKIKITSKFTMRRLALIDKAIITLKQTARELRSIEDAPTITSK